VAIRNYEEMVKKAGADQHDDIWNIIVGDRLSIGDLLADSLDGTFINEAKLDNMVQVLATPHDNRFVIIGICGDNERSNIVMLIHELGAPLEFSGEIP